MLYVKSLIFSIVFLVSGLAFSQEKPPILEWTELPAEVPIKAKMRLPEGIDYKIDGQAHKCFAVKEYQSLLSYATEYQALYDWRIDHEVMLNTFKLMGQVYDDRITNFKEQIGYLKSERGILVKQITEDQKNILELKSQSNRESLGWKIIAGIEMAGLVALATVASLK